MNEAAPKGYDEGAERAKERQLFQRPRVKNERHLSQLGSWPRTMDLEFQAVYLRVLNTPTNLRGRTKTPAEMFRTSQGAN